MRVKILGVPVDMGASRRGVDMGPSAIRYAGLAEQIRALGHDVEDLGNIEVPVPEEVDVGDSKTRYASTLGLVFTRVRDRLLDLPTDTFPVVIGGDHSLAIGTVAALGRRGSVGVIWMDAHADINTPETSLSGNVHGMPVATLMGRGHPDLMAVAGDPPPLSADRVAYVGLRDLDPAEKEVLRRDGIMAHTMTEVDLKGMKSVIAECLDHLSEVDQIHLSFDMDAIDPRWAPGTGTKVEGGLTYREAHLAMELLAASGRVSSADFAEINPILDEQNTTASMAAELICSLLGKTIL